MSSFQEYFSGSPPNQSDNKMNLSDVSASSSTSDMDTPKMFKFKRLRLSY